MDIQHQIVVPVKPGRSGGGRQVACVWYAIDDAKGAGGKPAFESLRDAFVHLWTRLDEASKWAHVAACTKEPISDALRSSLSAIDAIANVDSCHDELMRLLGAEAVSGQGNADALRSTVIGTKAGAA